MFLNLLDWMAGHEMNRGVRSCWYSKDIYLTSPFCWQKVPAANFVFGLISGTEHASYMCVVLFWFDSLTISSCLVVIYQDIIHAYRKKRRHSFLASVLLLVFHRIAGKFLHISQKLRFPSLHFHGFAEVLIKVEITSIHDWSKKNILIYIQCILKWECEYVEHNKYIYRN